MDILGPGIEAEPQLRPMLQLQQWHILDVFFFFFLFFRAALVAYGNSQARGQIGASAAGLRHSQNNAGSEPHLRPTPPLTAMTDP